MKTFIREILPYAVCMVLVIIILELYKSNVQLQGIVDAECAYQESMITKPSYSELMLEEHKKGYKEFVEEKKDIVDLYKQAEENYKNRISGDKNESPLLTCNGSSCDSIPVSKFPIGRVVCCTLEGKVPDTYDRCVNCMCVNTTVALETMAGTSEYHAINPIKGVDY